MEQYFVNYASLEQQRWMVADRARTDAFATAIAEIVRPGDFVIDVGAGTGILSILAAKAGARRVIGVEKSDMAGLARELVEKNGYQDIVEIFNGDARDLKLNEPADLIISEWLGHMAYVEGMFRSVIEVRDKWLKKDGKLLPSSVDVMLAPIDDRELYDEHGPGFWNKKSIHGIDFSHFTQRELQMGHSNQLHVPNKYLLASGKSIHSQLTKPAVTGDEWGAGQMEYRIERDGILNGFCGWFRAQLSPSVILDTAPNCPETHWEQTYFPFHPINIKTGDNILVEFEMAEPYPGSRLMDFKLRVGDHHVRYLVD